FLRRDHKATSARQSHNGNVNLPPASKSSVRYFFFAGAAAVAAVTFVIFVSTPVAQFVPSVEYSILKVCCVLDTSLMVTRILYVLLTGVVSAIQFHVSPFTVPSAEVVSPLLAYD